MTEKPAHDEIERYRAMVEALVERCVESVRRFELPQDATPVQERTIDG